MQVVLQPPLRLKTSKLNELRLTAASGGSKVKKICTLKQGMKPLEGTSTKPQIKPGFNIPLQLFYKYIPLGIQKLYVISANSSSDPMFSSSSSNTGFAAWYLQQALLGQRGGYMAAAPATPKPQDICALCQIPKSQRLCMDLSAGVFSKC